MFFEMFIKDALLPLVFVCIIWFIALVKARPQRVAEYQLLFSLPLPHRRIANRFYKQELFRFSWAPGVPVMILWTFFSYASFTHLCRISLVVFLWYAVIMMALINLNFSSFRFNPLTKYNPMLALPGVLFFAVGVFFIVLLDRFFSGISFWLSLFVFAGVGMVLWLLHWRLWLSWLRKNGLFKGVRVRPNTGALATLVLNFRSRLQPFLVKNLLKIARENSVLVSSLTGLYILFAYLVSGNNERANDVLAILFSAILLYAVIFSFKSQKYLSESEESRQIIYALPVKKVDLYLSLYAPAAVWLLLVSAILTLLGMTSHVGAVAGLLFWLKSTAISLGFFAASLNFAFAAYPDDKKGGMHFFLWGLALLILIALFYKYRYAVFLVMVLLSFIGVWKMKTFAKNRIGV